MEQKILISLHPYDFYLFVMGFKSWLLSKRTMPKNDEVYIYVTKRMNSLNKIPQEFRPDYVKLIGRVCAKCRFDDIRTFRQNFLKKAKDGTICFGRSDEKIEYVISESGLSLEEIYTRIPPGEVGALTHVADLELFEPCDLANLYASDYRGSTCSLDVAPQRYCYFDGFRKGGELKKMSEKAVVKSTIKKPTKKKPVKEFEVKIVKKKPKTPTWTIKKVGTNLYKRVPERGKK